MDIGEAARTVVGELQQRREEMAGLSSRTPARRAQFGRGSGKSTPAGEAEEWERTAEPAGPASLGGAHAGLVTAGAAEVDAALMSAPEGCAAAAPRPRRT